MLVEVVNPLTGQMTLKYVPSTSGSGNHELKGDTLEPQSKNSIQANGIKGTSEFLSQNDLLRIVGLLVSALSDLEHILQQSIAILKAQFKELEKHILGLPKKNQIVIKKMLKTIKNVLAKEQRELSHIQSLVTSLEKMLKNPSLIPADDEKQINHLLQEVQSLENSLNLTQHTKNR